MTGAPSDPPRLSTWTRTLNEDDAERLLDAAVPGTTLADWAERAHHTLPQAKRPRRTELIRLVRTDLLDHDGERILDSAFLRLFQGGAAHRRRGLLYGRWLRRRPLVARALDALIWPAIRLAEQPLAPEGSGEIPPAAWDAFLRATLPEGTSGEAFAKTRSTLQRALSRAGILEVTGARSRRARARRSEPDPLAFAWLLAHELKETGRAEIGEEEAIRDSFAARLFAPAAEYARACVEAGVREGLLGRSFLAGVPRLHPGEGIR